MRFSRLPVLALATLALSFVGCSTGGSISTLTQNAAAPPAAPQTSSGFTQSIMLSPAGGTFALKLPTGFTGSLTVGANNAPAGTSVDIGLAGVFASVSGGKHIDTTQTDPFPIVITIKSPITITLPIPGFSITFPSWVNLAQGTFDVSIYDPTQPVSYTSPTNPTLLGKATVSGQTLTFSPNTQKFTFRKGVAYPETTARDTGGTGVVLPLPGGTSNQNLPPNGQLGGSSVNTTSSASTFTQWTVAPFGNVLTFSAPASASSVVRRNATSGPAGTSAQGVESLVVQATGATTLTNTTLSFTFNPSGQPPIAGGPGTFPPGTGPVLGPYPATFNPSTGNWSATVTDPVTLAAGSKFGFELFTVTICAPANVFAPCDSSNPSNALTQLSGDFQEYDVLVSDQSETLNGLYSVSLTGSMPDGSALPAGVAPCSFVTEDSDNGDHPVSPPWPVYNDNWPTPSTGQAPNSEFDVNTGGPIPAGGDVCTWIVSYNGNPMAADNIGIGTGLTPAMKTRLMHRFIVKPPVNGPHVGGGG